MARRTTTFQFNEDDRGLSSYTEQVPLMGKLPEAHIEERREMALMESYEALRTAADEPFEDSNELHMRTLQELWRFSFPGEPFSRSSKLWSTLGFQGLDPTTDLRGAGFLGLQHLHHFVTTFQTLPLSCPSDFPLALASINCTAILVSYFGLNAKVVVPVPDTVRRSCRPTSDVQRAFVEMSALHPQATYQLQAIHVQLLHALARQWARVHTPTTTILDFPACLQSTYRHFHLSLAATTRPWNLHHVAANLQQPPWSTDDANSPCLSATPMISFLLMVVAQLSCCGRSVVSPEAYDYQPLGGATTAPLPGRAPPLVAAL